MNLHNNLKHRFSVSEEFTKDFHKRIKEAAKAYDAEGPEDKISYDADTNVIQIAENRYKMIYPLIFVNSESMLSSMFDRVPDLIFSGKGKYDEIKKIKIEAAYKYLVDKCSLEWFMNDTAWWFVVDGFATGHISYKKQYHEEPVIDEMGMPEVDPMTGEPKMRVVYDYDDPMVEAGDVSKEYFSPESEFDIKLEKTPYYFRKLLMDPVKVKEIYGKDVEPDATLEVNGDEKHEIKDLKRVQVWMYYGTVPKENKSEVKNWSYDATYLIVFTSSEILHKEPLKEKPARAIKWYGTPNKFFGFGLAHLLKNQQQEKTLRRGQQIRYADNLAFPKIAMDETGDLDDQAMLDPRENRIVIYKDKEPKYLVPPPMPDTLIQAEQRVDNDAQQISGLIDISTGAQQSSVDTATGQSIFAEAAAQRVRRAKHKFVEFYKQIVIGLLKEAQANWSTEKVVSITDDKGKDQQIAVGATDLSDVDFDTDIDIDGETMSINKDIIRQQSIEFYNTTKDDPLINRQEVIKDVMQQGFGKSNPDRYITKSNLQPGMTLVDPNTEQIYTVDKSGQVVPQETDMTIAEPTQGSNAVSSPSGMAGSVNNLS